jgi:hypothetical protein
MKEHRRVSNTGIPLSAIDRNFMDGLRNDFRNFINVAVLNTVSNKPGFGKPQVTDGGTISVYEQLTALFTESFDSVQGTQLPTSANDFKFRVNKSVTEIRDKLQAIEGMAPSGFNQLFAIYGTFALELCAKANTAQRQMNDGLGRS